MELAFTAQSLISDIQGKMSSMRQERIRKTGSVPEGLLEMRHGKFRANPVG